MKIRLSKKIMKHRPDFVYDTELLGKYWGMKMILFDLNWLKDHRITKAISLTRKKEILERKKKKHGTF